MVSSEGHKQKLTQEAAVSRKTIFKRYRVCYFLTILVLSLSGVARAVEGQPSWKSIALDLVPAPKECQATGREFYVGRNAKIAVAAPSDSTVMRTAAQVAVGEFRRRGFSPGHGRTGQPCRGGLEHCPGTVRHGLISWQWISRAHGIQAAGAASAARLFPADPEASGQGRGRRDRRR
jgi:hypothetical protein